MAAVSAAIFRVKDDKFMGLTADLATWNLYQNTVKWPMSGDECYLIPFDDAIAINANFSADATDSTKTVAQRQTALEAGLAAQGGLFYIDSLYEVKAAGVIVNGDCPASNPGQTDRPSL